MGAKKATLANALLDAVLKNVTYTSPTSVFVALFTVAPTASTSGTEVTGGAYVRKAVTFSAASGGATSNTNAVTFPIASAAWGTVNAAAICDAATAGNQLYFGNLGTPKSVGSGDQLNFAIAALSVTEN
jgi:hypothetical protein